MRRACRLFALLSAGISGCGAALDYETVEEVEPAPSPAARAAWQDAPRELVERPPRRLVSTRRSCADDLRDVRDAVGVALESAIAQRAHEREGCLARTAQNLKAMYLLALAEPFKDETGRAIELEGTCPADDLAIQARSCE